MEQIEALSSIKDEKSETIAKAVSKEDVAALISQLKSTSFREVYKSLSKIRCFVVHNDDSIFCLREANGFKCLIKFLTVSNEDILNLALNVMISCCTERFANQELRKDVLKYGITSKVVGILQNINNENIQKKVCRLIGSLSQALSLARELNRANVTLAILPIINTSKNTSVLKLAVKALRVLWEADRSYADIYMLKAGAVKSVATLLSSEDEELVLTVLMALVVFTKPCSAATAEQIHGSGTGYGDIVSKMQLPIARILIYNLSHSPPARVELCRVGVVPSIIKKLEDGKIDSHLITALCCLCWESMARASLRTTPKGFQTLLSLLSNYEAKDLHLKILSAITQFNYDKQSVMMMVRAGLIGILVEMLSGFVKRYGSQHEEPSVEQWSPSCSPPSDSSLGVTSSSNYSSGHSPVDSDDAFPANSCIMNAEKKTKDMGEDSCILDILTQLTYQNTSLRPLASKTTISTLLDYLVCMWYPHKRPNYIKAVKTLSAIVACKDYYSSLLDDESVLLIHRELCRPRHSGDCDQCLRMKKTGKNVLGDASLAAHSGLGEGAMYYRLSMAADHVKSSVALTIPHIIKKPFMLHNLLIGHSTLNTLLESLDSRIEEAVPSLHELFSTLGIVNKQIQLEVCQHCDIGRMKKEANVTFVLDDGSHVGANKESLSHNCPVFEAMFRGAFKESHQSAVRLTDVSVGCLTHLTRLVDSYCSCLLPKDLDTLLELVTVADRFLLPDLMESALSYIMNISLTHTTCHRVYEWGLRVGYTLPATSHVANAALVFLLASDMTCANRVTATSRILAGEYRQQFKHDLTIIIISELQSYCKQNKVCAYFKDNAFGIL